MTEGEHLYIIETIYKEMMNSVYQTDFLMKLFMTKSFNPQIENDLNIIDNISSVVENIILIGDTHRALKYICVLKKLIRELQIETEKVYTKEIKTKLFNVD